MRTIRARYGAGWRPSGRASWLTAFVAVALLALPTSAVAQVGYFGQNKVQYRDFTFHVLKTAHFDIYYYTEEADAAKTAGRLAERWYARFAALFDHQLHNRQPLILYGSGAQFRQTNVVEGQLGQGTGGVTEAYKRRIVLPFAGPISETDHVLGHELVHAFQYDVTNTSASGAGAGQPGVLALPLWFIEGMAEYLSLGPDDPNTAMWMRDAVRREQLPDIDKLDNPKYFPYRYGEALWAYIGGKYGDKVIGQVLRVAAARGDYKYAFKRVLGITSKDLSTQWHDATVAAFKPVAEMTKMPEDFAQPLIVDKTGKGGVNVSPELSPDGSKIIFFSSRDLFSIDLFVADAKTGRVIRQITNTATNPHWDSLEFIESAGAWSHDGRRFAFPGIVDGNPVLTIVDVDHGRKERDVTLKTLDEVVNPAWSPDGRSIAFSGMAGGFMDLFVYDLQQNHLERLTHDAYAELDPVWSPDGRSLVFSTDRFTTNLADLDAGELRLAKMDVGSRDVQPFGGFEHAKNISPQFSADGRSVYFVSDRQGISDVYRLDVDSGATTQVTNLLTGVTGITGLSPALSAAASRVAFSVYENDGYNIYTIDTSAKLAGTTLASNLPHKASILPPRTTGEGTVYAMLNAEHAGLPAATTQFPTQPYHPHLSIDYLGQPVVGVGVDAFGSYVAGGVGAVFSDILGNHTVGADIQLTSRLDETGGSLVYLNRTHRWNWGAAFDQTPYVLRGFQDTLVGTDTGQPLIEEDEIRTLQVDRGVSGIALYPFSRAQRIEVSGGFRQITGKQDVTTRLYDYFSGQQVAQNSQTLSHFPTLNLGTASSALVYDTSIFGATSPILGSRYRLEYDQVGGSLTYGSALADYRRYFMPFRPYTFALRGLYYGRFERDSDSSLLTPVFIGYPDLVRGYDYGSFQPQECGSATDGSCPSLDRLIGSRMLVLNAELRFPLWGAFGGDNFYGPVPIELAVFGDAGAAWSKGERLRFTGPDRDFVRSIGAAARINVFGYAVAEVDYVRPLDRPGRGWMWEFNLSPGF
ncbi:MAG TPA: BamA/TamA family outer membrane protein [Vicinamibacterales bacterium]|nr:BamA/TamA family outer membrane protein [Vicinamibacterales bacterium]